jgi:hypothetical protein
MGLCVMQWRTAPMGSFGPECPVKWQVLKGAAKSLTSSETGSDPPTATECLRLLPAPVPEVSLEGVLVPDIDRKFNLIWFERTLFIKNTHKF